MRRAGDKLLTLECCCGISVPYEIHIRQSAGPRPCNQFNTVHDPHRLHQFDTCNNSTLSFLYHITLSTHQLYWTLSAPELALGLYNLEHSSPILTYKSTALATRACTHTNHVAALQRSLGQEGGMAQAPGLLQPLHVP